MRINNKRFGEYKETVKLFYLWLIHLKNLNACLHKDLFLQRKSFLYFNFLLSNSLSLSLIALSLFLSPSTFSDTWWNQIASDTLTHTRTHTHNSIGMRRIWEVTFLMLKVARKKHTRIKNILWNLKKLKQADLTEKYLKIICDHKSIKNCDCHD